MEPAVGLQDLGGLLRQPVVALHDAGAAQQDLAVVGDAYLGAGHRLADGAGAVGLAGVDEGGRGGLGEAVPLQDVDPGAGEEVADLGCEGRRPGDAGAQAAAERLTDLGIDQLVGDGVLRGEAEGALAVPVRRKLSWVALAYSRATPAAHWKILYLAPPPARALAATPL